MLILNGRVRQLEPSVFIVILLIMFGIGASLCVPAVNVFLASVNKHLAEFHFVSQQQIIAIIAIICTFLWGLLFLSFMILKDGYEKFAHFDLNNRRFMLFTLAVLYVNALLSVLLLVSRDFKNGAEIVPCKFDSFTLPSFDTVILFSIVLSYFLIGNQLQHFKEYKKKLYLETETDERINQTRQAFGLGQPVDAG